jgi:hypothetical protein
MTQDELETAIKQRWESNWEALHPQDPEDPDYVPYTYDNESFGAVAVWAHLAIEPTVRARTTQGRQFAKYEARGIIRIRLFGSIDVGASQLAGFVDEIVGTPETEGVLDEGRFGDVIYREGTHRPGPSDGAWAMRVIVVPYELSTQNNR